MTNVAIILINATRLSDDTFHIETKNNYGLFELLDSMDTVVGVNGARYKFSTNFKRVSVNSYEQSVPELLQYDQVSKTGLKILNRSLLVNHADIIEYYKANNLSLDTYVPANPALFFCWSNYQTELRKTPIKIRLVTQPQS